MSDKLILLAEDNVVNQQVAVHQLQKLDYRADVVADRKEALEDRITKSAAEDEVPPVDVQRLYQAIGEEPDELREILDIYLTQLSQNLVDLDKAILAGDAETVELIAHNCAGTSANCGVTAVVDPFYKLERMGRERHLAGAANVAAKASHEFARVKLFLEENFQQVMA